MSDIGKTILEGQERPENPKKESRLQDLGPWDEASVRERADAEQIELTPTHWDVLEFLREYYIEHGRAKSGRELVYELDDRYEGQGGRRFLYQLFPRGPVTQGCKIAGVPTPAYTTDPSFGSVE
ncbi:TusE/DsrC/DsvC family sulfur relay protein [Thiohalomonas denitrificans]|uniref:tRNA 2-thiouridine synthesizing protein E n=1 Tax=Thiohalomonas denitrificans TaxID=415747 RepID=A0A1G5QBC1_9GAMM|nr:TusE/DsrC/DsvC family sulfur relay protein [Thiohalomonas denitrificans]SCZ58997.1 tRNA 2-thiouridine synthesizing protein E [Thiohalomonas denitrificans]